MHSVKFSDSVTSLFATYSANQLKAQENIKEIIENWASQHPLFEYFSRETRKEEIITAFYKARMHNDANSLYKAGEYCRDHPELGWDIQAIIFFHDSIEQRYIVKKDDPEVEQKIKAAQENLDNLLLDGRGISEFTAHSTNRKVRDYCLDRLIHITQKESGSRASDARYQLMEWYLSKSDFVSAVKYFKEAANCGSQSGKFGLRALISLLQDNRKDMQSLDDENLMKYLDNRADRVMYIQSDEYADVWDKNRLLIYERYYASAAQWGDVKAQTRAFNKGDYHYAESIGMSYYYGENDVDQDMNLASYYLTEAIKQEQKSEIAHLLAHIYEDPTMKQDQDTKKKASYYRELAAEQGYGPAYVELLDMQAKEDPSSAFLLYELFRSGDDRYELKPDKSKSQKYLVMAADKSHTAAVQEYLRLWRCDQLLPEFLDIVKCRNYEDKLREDAELINIALKSLDDYESGRVKAPEYGPNPARRLSDLGR